MDELGTITACMRHFASGQGSEPEFAVIHRWLSGVLLRQIGRRGTPGSPSDGEDITAAALSELWRAFTGIRDGHSGQRVLGTILTDGDRWQLTNWVLTVARRVAHRRGDPFRQDGSGAVTREAEAGGPPDGPLDPPSPAVGPVDEAIYRELIGRVEAAIGSLPEDRQLACLLRLRGYKFTEIARRIFEHTGKVVPADTVSSWFTRGELRNALERAVGYPAEDV